MDIQNVIVDIKQKIKSGGFPNEASVIQGIVMRILASLDWPSYDTQIVYPEYSLEGQRVDIALCHPKGKPLVFIEVKQLGNSDGADRQLFEYAFHKGVPMAILTGGQEWHFYLPAEQGSYQERRVYNLDILERELPEIAHRFKSYLSYDNIKSGIAIDTARKDYKGVSKIREIEKNLPIAWDKLISDQDELLIELIIDQVESLCGYKPSLEQVENFLLKIESNLQSSIDLPRKPLKKSKYKPKQGIKKSISSQDCGFVFRNNFYPAKNAIDVLIKLFEKFTEIDDSFPKRFSSLPKHGRKRRYLAEDKYKLYPDRQDLAEEKSYELKSGWWVGTNYNKRSIKKIITIASEVMNLKIEKDVKVQLGE